MYGGADDDTLFGGWGNDTLQDGSGADQLTGGSGADVFVLTRDGTTDRIMDFQDAIDLIDLNTAFSTLTITTLKRGGVQIDTGTDMLLVFDTAHHLTAASFTAADFA